MYYIRKLQINIQSVMKTFARHRGSLHLSQAGTEIQSRMLVTECRLIVLRLFLIVSLPLSVTFGQIQYSWSSASTKRIGVCNDQECQDRAKSIIESMDKHADPCKDFYQYICGKWHVANPIPSHQFEWSVEAKLDFHSIQEMKELLKHSGSTNEPKNVKKAKQFYDICSHFPYMAKKDAKHLRAIIKRAGPWPMFNVEQKFKVSWLDIHNYYLKTTGDTGLFRIGLHYDRKTSDISIEVSNAATPFGLIQRFGNWNSDDIVRHQHFLLMLIRMVSDTSNKPEDKNLLLDLAEVLSFRQKLEKNFHPDSTSYSPMTVKYFSTWYNIKATSQKYGTKIPWLEVFRSVLSNTTFDIDEDTKVELLYRDSFSSLPRILSNTPKHVIANHLHLYFIEKHILMNEEVENGLSKLLIRNGKIVGNAVPRLDRSDACVLFHPLKETLGKMYVSQYFDEGTKDAALYFANKMKDIIKLQINNSQWLNSKTKDLFTSKVTDLDLLMTYQNNHENENIDHKNIKMTPYRAISFYAPKENNIFIGAGYLRAPVFGRQMPSAVNYGTIATFIAYEMYHALNVEYTHKEPKTGKPICKYCWSEVMLKLLEESSKCFEDIYTDLMDNDLGHIKPHPKTDGAQTLYENIADIMGIRAGMDGFMKALQEKKGNCRVLPHMKDLTCEKLFFISYATTFCSASPAWLLLKHMQTGTHSTPRFRVNVPLANMVEFRKAFHCPVDSPMVSKKSCYLW